MFPPSITDSEAHLGKSISPKRWENLGGPFQWFTFADPNPALVQHDEFGWIVSTVPAPTKMGTLASALNTGRLPYPAILFNGPPGTGKTATQKLITRTFLTRVNERQPVTYEAADGRVITLLNKNTGKPWMLNPGTTGLGAEPYAEAAFTQHGTAAVRQIRYYNCSRLNKSQLDQMSEDIRLPLMPGEKRVYVFNEFDELTKPQVAPIKSMFDNGSFPTGVLVMADTNKPSKVMATLGRAGRERFEHFDIRAWEEAEIRDLVSRILPQLNIHTEDAKDDLASSLARVARGSLRLAITTLERFRKYEGKAVTPEQFAAEFDLAGETREDRDIVDAGTGAVFVSRALKGDMTSVSAIRSFIDSLLRTDTLFSDFAKSVAEEILQQKGRALFEQPVSDNLRVLFTLSCDGEDNRHLRFAAAALPLLTIATALQS